MIGACLWVVQVLVKLLKRFQLRLNGLPRTSCILIFPNILHLLDDFLIISPSTELCQKQLDTFFMLCSYLGIPMAPERTVGPSTTIAFAGIELDTVLMEARLPQEKLDKCCCFP